MSLGWHFPLRDAASVGSDAKPKRFHPASNTLRLVSFLPQYSSHFYKISSSRTIRYTYSNIKVNCDWSSRTTTTVITDGYFPVEYLASSPSFRGGLSPNHAIALLLSCLFSSGKREREIDAIHHLSLVYTFY